MCQQIHGNAATRIGQSRQLATPDMLVQHDAVDEQRHWTGTGLGVAYRPEGVSMLRLVSAVCWLPMTYSFGIAANAVRGEDRNESVGSTIIFSDLTFVGWPASGKSRGVLKRQGRKAVSLLKCGTEMAVA